MSWSEHMQDVAAGIRGDARGARNSGMPWATRSPVLAANGAAATSQPLATQIALDILKSGGSAVDAAIAANAALGVMEPTDNGIGGDLFAMVWDPKSAKLHGLNASGRAPLGQTLDALLAKLKGRSHIPEYGSLSVTVPGAVDGWFALHGRFGRLQMCDVLAPAIDYARKGFPLSQFIAYSFGRYKPSFEQHFKDGLIEEIDNYKSTFLRGDQPYREGEIFTNPDLASTLETLADDGRNSFYEGALADVMDAYLKRIGAPLRKRDLEAHQSTWVDPVSIEYRGWDVYELPPNGQGVAALQMLNILKHFDLAAMGPLSPDALHVMTEAKKLAFADRARFYADPQFYNAPLTTLLSDDYAAQRAKLIDMNQAMDCVDHGPATLLKGDTVYLTVADAHGMMVSLIQSNYLGMGSGLVPDGLGFMLQDRGAQFALDPAHPNVYAPGKRPFHTIIPAFVMRDGRPLMSFGVMGGAMQPQGHAQIVVNMRDFGMNVQEAGDLARFHHVGSTEPTGAGEMRDGGTLELEAGVQRQVIDALQARGHTIRVTTGPFGGYQAIYRDPKTGVYWAASEMRKDGQAAGF
ncbi:MAG: gamma-glutamyltransferase [Pseudomonadota bacterium]